MDHTDEIYIKVGPGEFKGACLKLHKDLHSPVMLMFMDNEHALYCGFIDQKNKKWHFVAQNILKDSPSFESIARDIYSAHLFEREIHELYGVMPVGSPDLRSLRRHEEVLGAGQEYPFMKVEGAGIFEVPVGPVHAGIIGPGHFRFSVAGEPIINLEIRLGYTHRGVEKLIEGKTPLEVLPLTEAVAGDSAFAHSLAFCHAVEKIGGVEVPARAQCIRAILLELERMYNHIADAGAIGVDVGYTFVNAYASIMKESILVLNERLTDSRYLKNVNTPGGLSKDILVEQINLKEIKRDFNELKEILYSSVSFLDRVETTGVLKKKIAEDYGIIGLVGRASGIAMDLRQRFSELHQVAGFKMCVEQEGDVAARLKVRLAEFEESIRLIEYFVKHVPGGEVTGQAPRLRSGYALGYVEGWRGPVLYWVKINKEGKIDRCKIVDPSFHNWPGLTAAVLGNIIPDFPVCNKSFNLSYAGSDL